MIASPLIDYETLIDTLFRRDLPGFPALSELDTDVSDTLPAIRYALAGTGQTGNGPGLFNVVLTWNTMGSPADAWQAMTASYAAIHAWPLLDAVEGVGWVSSVTDTSLPTRPSSPDLAVKSNTQYAATVALVLRN